MTSEGTRGDLRWGTIPALLRDVAATDADREAVVDLSGDAPVRLTFAELRAWADAVARGGGQVPGLTDLNIRDAIRCNQHRNPIRSIILRDGKWLTIALPNSPSPPDTLCALLRINFGHANQGIGSRLTNSADICHHGFRAWYLGGVRCR